MTDRVITHERIKDTIVLENEYPFTVFLTVGLEKGGDFCIEIEFCDLDEASFKTAANLYKLAKAIAIQSPFLRKEEYPISHIVVTNMNANNLREMNWDCVSDDPNMSLIVE